MKNPRLKRFYDFDRLLEKEGCVFVYRGPMSREMVSEMTGMLSLNLAAEQVALKFVRKLCMVIIEGAENILQHSKLRNKLNDEDTGIGLISVRKSDKRYFVHVENYISTEQMHKIDSFLKTISSLEEEGIKEYCRNKIKKMDLLSESESVGLGLAHIYLTVDSPPRWSFSKISDHTCYYSLLLTIHVD